MLDGHSYFIVHPCETDDKTYPLNIRGTEDKFFR